MTFHCCFYCQTLAEPLLTSPVNGVKYVQTPQKNQDYCYTGASYLTTIIICKRSLATGANVVRFNLFHGSPEDHQNRANKVREIASELGRHAVSLGDLRGPKILVSTFKEGEIFFNVGDKFLLDDGRVQLKVLQVQGMKVFTEVTMGGPLSNNKGINNTWQWPVS